MMNRPQKPRLALVLAFLPIAVAGLSCAGNRNDGSRAEPRAITALELEGGEYANVYDAVSRLRPEWMRQLGGAYLLDQRIELAELRLLPLMRISRIELLSAEEATRRFGTRSLSSTYLLIITR